MYRQKAPSVLPKSTLALFHLSVVCAAACLLFGGGIRTVSGWLNLGSDLASPLRRALLLGAAAIYFLRVLVTLFVFLKRRMGWAEVGTVAAWIGALHMCFAFFGGRQTAPVGLIELVGVLLYLGGSYLNSGSEHQRHVWKQQPQHQGQLYTEGLFRYAIHINYFGDLVLFTGWVLLTARAVLLLVPVVMLWGFVILNIPALDHYLAERYGEAFGMYAARTKKLVPFVY